MAEITYVSPDEFFSLVVSDQEDPGEQTTLDQRLFGFDGRPPPTSNLVALRDVDLPVTVIRNILAPREKAQGPGSSA